MKSRNANLLNLCLAAAVMSVSFGCGSFMKGFKEGYDTGRGASSNTVFEPKSNSQTKSSGGLADEIIGTWEMQGQDKTRFTFGADGSLIVKQAENAAPQNATYTVLDNEAIQAKSPGKPPLVIIIKITGDTMRMNTANRGNEILKRIN